MLTAMLRMAEAKLEALSCRSKNVALRHQAFKSRHSSPSKRSFASSSGKNACQSIADLPTRLAVQYKEVANSELLCLKWSQPPRNLLLVRKECSENADEALREFATHVKSTYPAVNIILESHNALQIHDQVPFDVFAPSTSHPQIDEYADKVDFIATFGGDGTILHAASLFATSAKVPPILSFSMGTLGFLGEWNFSEYKRAFREAYMSGSDSERKATLEGSELTQSASVLEKTGWSSIRGKSMGSARGASVLVRQRLKVGVFDSTGKRLSSNGDSVGDIHAMNEVLIHRGKDPHLAIVEVYVGGRFLTEAVADGMIISTPTGSTAYSLSSGGSIIHPLVPSLLLTPVCPRSLSFRPLVLPATTPITLKLSQKNRGREVEVSIDGVRRSHSVGVGTEIRVSGEEIVRERGDWQGGIPCIMRRTRSGAEGDDGWVGGLTGLLKFNYPFGEDG